MTLLVPFDGSELAEAALVRATEFARVFDEDVLAVCVIPEGNAPYAKERDWIAEDDRYDIESVVSNLHEQVVDLAPSADFRHKRVDKYAPPGTISTRIRNIARQEDVSMVFIGSDNAGHLVTSVSSVGGNVAADGDYDVVIVRDRSPAKIAKLRDASPHRKQKSDFYLPE